MRVAKEEPSSSLADTVESSPAPRKGSAAVAGLLDRPAVLARPVGRAIQMAYQMSPSVSFITQITKPNKDTMTNT